jgi:hypothetical protein
LTNKGLRIEVDLVLPSPNEEYFTAYLNCKENGQSLTGDHRLGIYLRKISDDQYIRVRHHKIRYYPLAPVESKQATAIFITGPDTSSIGISRWKSNLAYGFGFTPSCNQCIENGFLLVNESKYGAIGEQNTAGRCSIFLHDSEVSALKFEHESKAGVQFVVVFGITNYCVWADIEIMFEDESLSQILSCYFKKDIGTKQNHARRYRARQNLRDRVTAPLQDGSTASVALKKAVVSGQVQYLVNISVTSTLKSELSWA